MTIGFYNLNHTLFLFRAYVRLAAIAMMTALASAATANAAPEPALVMDGHGSGQLFALSYSPDGRLIATGSRDGTVALWNASDGALIRRLEGHANFVRDVAFSPDGRTIATASWDDTVRLHDVSTGAALWIADTGRRVTGVAFDPDGDEIAVVGWTAQVRILNSANGEVARTLEGHPDYVHAVAYSPDGALLATSGADRQVRVWDARSGETVALLPSKFGDAVAFSPDGAILATTDNRKLVTLWDVERGVALRQLKGHRADVEAVVFSPDGTKIATGSRDEKTFKLWDARTGALLATVDVRREYSVWSLDFSPSGRMLVTGHADGVARGWLVEALW